MIVGRRDFLVGSLAGGIGLGTLGCIPSALAAQPKALSFYHIHTGEKLRIVYSQDGQPIPDALDEISHFLRDFRSGGVHAIDTDLLDTLSTLYGGFSLRGRFEVISGYRSPRTNEALRKAGAGVAKSSLHLSGRAIDVRLSGIPTAELRRAAVALARGGVGYYPKSDFVHLDTGRVRAW